MKLLIALLLSPMIARAQVNVEQDVVRSSITIGAITLGTAFTQVDTPKMTDSWLVEVQNLSTEQVCCTFDSGSVAPASGKACVRIDTATTAARATSGDWKRWKRYAQNLSLFCRSLKGSGGTAEIIVTQGK